MKQVTSSDINALLKSQAAARKSLECLCPEARQAQMEHLLGKMSLTELFTWTLASQGLVDDTAELLSVYSLLGLDIETCTSSSLTEEHSTVIANFSKAVLELKTAFAKLQNKTVAPAYEDLWS